jgi:hypothetical protein
MIAPSDPVLSSNSAAPLDQFHPTADHKEAFDEKVVVIVGKSSCWTRPLSLDPS